MSGLLRNSNTVELMGQSDNLLLKQLSNASNFQLLDDDLGGLIPVDNFQGNIDVPRYYTTVDEIAAIFNRVLNDD